MSASQRSLLISMTGLLVLNFAWPRSVLPSILVTPFLMGVSSIAVFAVAYRPKLPWLPGIWVGIVVVAVALGPDPESLALIGLAAAGICAWITIALGQRFGSDTRLLTGFKWALVVGMLLNVVVAGMQYFDVEQMFYPFVSQNDSNRPYGSLRQANHLATFSVIGLLAVWWLLRERLLSNRFVVTLAVIALSGVALSASRTGILELCVLSCFFLLWRRQDNPLEFRLFVLAPAWTYVLIELLHALTALIGSDLDGIRGRDMASVSIRFFYWQEAWSLALLHPVSGVGWGNLGAARLFELPFNSEAHNTTNAHNLVLHLLAETGFATTFLVLAPIGWMLWRRPPWRATNASSQWAWMVIAVVGLHSLLEYPIWYMNFMIPTAFAFGVLLSAQRVDAQPGSSLPGGLTAILGALLLVASALAFFDYIRVARVFKQDGRATADLSEVASVQNTFLYRYYADRALVERVPLTDSNAIEMLKVTDRLLKEGPNPLVFWVRLEGQCRTGDTLRALETALLFKTVFPKAHAEFMEINSPSVLKACGLVSTKALEHS
ncbi:MAG: Wzy polymerase domain-containing protein [Hydrogenophaga sp.]|uniref:PglL family O-oligosaccharyltransferase n=1 Tax=Hydrogenophaga sp. TaxID=1904254 RepID=UPI002AB86F99|nr:Wzy polymerase domain-containing protein [Hydrogenophaga sp.]MDZ4103611.1 Wzy polymerase domain-containing protein [Hydrogenophaga sp.]MDZ4283104.1 Wzy polymerase domain-containing protein [Hydrogenophaga sp.]